MASVEDAARRLQAYNPRLTAAFAYHLAKYGTRTTKNRNEVLWKFDPLHHTRSPQPFYLEQARAFWSRITSPALLVFGELSPFQCEPPENRERIAGARETVISGASHMVHHDQPELLARAIGSFLKEIT